MPNSYPLPAVPPHLPRVEGRNGDPEEAPPGTRAGEKATHLVCKARQFLAPHGPIERRGSSPAKELLVGCFRMAVVGCKVTISAAMQVFIMAFTNIGGL